MGGKAISCKEEWEVTGPEGWELEPEKEIGWYKTLLLLMGAVLVQ